MAADYAFTEEEMAIEEGLGYPRAFAKICRDQHLGPYSHGPPFTFMPYALQQNECLRVDELDKMFPVIDPKARPTAKLKIFVNLLWEQLSHLGNAGFDPEVIRVDPYGNVLYFHADSASPLYWDIDHWFPCSRGGLTVASNLRILQWQVCKKKHNKLEFQVPWWDFQLGISVNQFLSIFATQNSDFRHRGFFFLFAAGENEEMNSSQTVESHSFPQHFMQSKEQFGLAPAAVVLSRRELYNSPLKSLDYNMQIRPRSPIMAAKKMQPNILKENENPDFVANPYQAIVMARDSLKQKEEAQKMHAEIQKLDEDVHEMKRKNEDEKHSIQELEIELVKRKRRAEKCRRLAEAQSSYRNMLEKMIRDAMHQSVVYKEQVRLNQAAANALMARLEAQKAICDAAEKELYKKFKQRDELEKQVRPEWEHARKRSRTDDTFLEGQDSKTVLYLPGIGPGTTSLHKELRVFLEEEQKASVCGLSSNEDQKHEEIKEEAITVKNTLRGKREEHDKAIAALEIEKCIEHKFQRLDIEEQTQKIQFPLVEEIKIEEEEDEDRRRQRGKGNVEKWLQMLLESTQDELEDSQNADAEEAVGTDDMLKKLDLKYPHKEKEAVKQVSEKQQCFQEKDPGKKKEEIAEIEDSKTCRRRSYAGEVSDVRSRKGGIEKKYKERILVTQVNEKEEIAEIKGSSRVEVSDVRSRKEGIEKKYKERIHVRSESARAFRRIPSSPSLILGMRKGVECMRKKPIVTSDDEDAHAARHSFLKSSIKTIKKAVKI